MTTEKETFEGIALVSEAYRELDVENAPEQLNQRILKMASKEGKKANEPGFLFTAWMKPLAWTATIGLSIAIVLEFSELPTATVPSDALVLQEEAAMLDSNRAEEVAPERRDISEDEIRKDVGTRDAFEELSRQQKSKSEAVAAPAQSSPVPATAASETSSARKRAVNLPADGRAMASFSIQAEQKESDTANSCDEAIRLSREDWLECIDNLRLSGALEAADREYQAFILKYSLESRDMEGNK
jgi:hypothetical protein